ncbi:hypothetical protein [Asticcacaulis sp. AC402]|uniref:hypothetical protein n=1 Tax=Asticcacaulis sp. AC402 TaxID=1282361 RepID=UPI0003C401B2|nr:hypothetical protein [Asticcacaulis sp. AC402]ESQ76834.1 hypothetical protein ABAC402_04000 [Asticcacaulis sp. AC402]
MRTEAYTPDAICESLGVGKFDLPWQKGQPWKQLRILLCPSFGPEVFLNLWEADGKAMARVVVGRTQIWNLPSPGRVTSDHSVNELTDTTFDQIERHFRLALVEPSPSVVTIDGMRVHILLKSAMSTIQIKDNPGRSKLGEYLAATIERLYYSTNNQRCRNGLAQAGSYVEMKLASTPEKDLEEVSTIMVVGAPDEQAEMLEAIAVVAVRAEAGGDEA